MGETKQMPYSAAAVANYFLKTAEAAGVTLTPMKLLKLVYYAHGWNLAIFNEPLIREQVEAWKWGPVIRSLYHDLKKYGNGKITERIESISLEDGRFKFTRPIVGDKSDPDGVKRQLLDKIWEIYRGYRATTLSDMTHELGSPWDQVMRKYKNDPPRGTDIPEDTIREYFVKKAESKSA